MSTIKIVYDPECQYYAGIYHCQSCERQCFGNGEALHRDTCPDRYNGYKNSVFTFGPRQIEDIKKWAELYDENALYHNVSLKMLKERWPHLLQESEAK